MGKINLFDYATKELSQDAFFSWFLMWASKECKELNENLHLCSQEFLRFLMTKCENIGEIQNICIECQIPTKKDVDTEDNDKRKGKKFIDIWVEITTDKNKYLVIIEDKTNTQQHDEQLEVYKKYATDWCNNNKYKEPICIYLKTGIEPNFNVQKVESKGYKIISRKCVLDIFDKYPNIQNHIFSDFCLRLKKLDELENFENKPQIEWQKEDCVSDWRKSEKGHNKKNYGYCNGFYQKLDYEFKGVYKNSFKENREEATTWWSDTGYNINYEFGFFNVTGKNDEEYLMELRLQYVKNSNELSLNIVIWFATYDDGKLKSYKGFSKETEETSDKKYTIKKFWQDKISDYAKVFSSDITQKGEFKAKEWNQYKKGYSSIVQIDKEHWLELKDNGCIDLKCTIDKLKNCREFLYACLNENKNELKNFVKCW